MYKNEYKPIPMPFYSGEKQAKSEIKAFTKDRLRQKVILNLLRIFVNYDGFCEERYSLKFKELDFVFYKDGKISVDINYLEGELLLRFIEDGDVAFFDDKKIAYSQRLFDLMHRIWEVEKQDFAIIEDIQNADEEARFVGVMIIPRGTAAFSKIKTDFLHYKLHELRKELNITQTALAEIMNVAQSTISEWESDASNINLSSLRKYAEVFNKELIVDFKDIEETK